jgi:hypothetical protein
LPADSTANRYRLGDSYARNRQHVQERTAAESDEKETPLARSISAERRSRAAAELPRRTRQRAQRTAEADFFKRLVNFLESFLAEV